MNGIQDVTKDAVSLGEGFTITGGFGAVTRSYYEESIDGTTVSLKSKWEPNDSVGAAWYFAYNAFDAQTGAATNGFAFSSPSVYASNHPFTRVDKEGDVETAEFETVTNMFAGKYTLYYPFDKTVAQAAASIPVKANVNQTMDVANPLKHVNEEIFFYTNGAYTKGGNQAEEFQMSPVPVLYRLNFAAKTETVKGLIGQDIVKVVISSDSNNKLFSEGEIKPNGTGLEMTSKYSNVSAKTSDYSLEFKGNEGNADYQISAIGVEGATKKPVYLSILPADNSISKLTFTVITADGKVYTDELDITTELKNEITVEGGFFNHTIQLENVDADAGIYNAQQFNAAWEKAVADGAGTLTLAAPLSLDELTLTKAGAEITIKGDKLTVGELNISGGDLSIGTDASLEATDVTIGALGELSDASAKDNSTKITGTLTVGLSGNADLEKVSEIKNVVAEAGSTVSLKGGKVSGSFKAAYQSTVELKGITLAGTNTIAGAVSTSTTAVKFTGNTTVAEKAVLTVGVDGTEFKNLDNKGTVTLSNTATIVNGGTFNNNGTLTLTAALTNKGTLNLYVNPTCTTAIANAGTINVYAADATTGAADLKVENSSTAAGTVNINLPKADDVITFAGLKYCETVNVNNGVLKESTAAAFANNAEIVVAENGKVSLPTSSSYAGMIIVNKDGAITGEGTATNIACYISKLGNFSSTTIGTVVINEPTTITSTMATNLAGKDVVVEADITLDADLTISANKAIKFNESVTITGTAATKQLTGSNSSDTFEVAEGKIVTVGKNAKVIVNGGFATKNVNTSGYGVIIAQGGEVTL